MKKYLLFALALFSILNCQPAKAADPVDFNEAYSQIIVPNEGFYVFNPADLGGETYIGVARKFNPLWKGWPEIDRVKAQLPAMPKYGSSSYYPWVKRLNVILKADLVVQNAVKSYYLNGVWKRYHLEEFPSDYQPLADCILDTFVNNGEIAGKWMHMADNRANHRKRVVRVAVDSEDIKSIVQGDAIRFALAFCGYRFAKYDRIADRFSWASDTWLDREGKLIIKMVRMRDAILAAKGRRK